jgi:hypothetical protein
MTSITLAAAIALPGAGAQAQQPVEAMPGLTIQTKIVPKRLLLLLSAHGYDLDVDFHIDGSMPEFSSFLVQCELDQTNDRDRHGAVWLKIGRSEFKPESEGGWIAKRDAIFIPGDTLTGVKCRIQSSPE